MRKVVLLCFLLLLSALAQATHIVGGELNLQYTNRNYWYMLSVNLYFDDINGEQEAEDEEIFVGVFSKRTHKQIGSYTLPRVSSGQISYTNATCSNSRLRTRQIVYKTEVNLDPNSYSEAEGYYISWERCCRNRAIQNILEPGDNGMVFYLEFPAVTLNGNRIINSSPAFTTPLGDYACVNEPFVFDFSATDADGDQLRYSLVTPKRGSSVTNAPYGVGPHPGARGIFFPAPYPSVTWASGYSVSNVIPGSQPLRVNSTNGQITFTANRVGLFVFSVICEEFRNGTKIGEVQRDFQLLVIDCQRNDPPVLKARAGNEAAGYQAGELITLRYTGQPCVEVWVKDPDPGALVTVDVQALNFSGQALSVFPQQRRLLSPADSLRSRICFNTCIPHSQADPLLLQVIASDNGCPIPKRDTLLLRVYIEALPTGAPEVNTTLATNSAVVQAGSSLGFDVVAADPDNDQISLYAVGEGFDLAEAGMQFKPSSGNGKITQPFLWNPACELPDNPAAYTVHFITEDNSCAASRFDTVTVTLQLESFDNVISRFDPPNVFTPNNDGANDFFQIPGLPPDNCGFAFKSIEIYNRWGTPVFSAYQREFQWTGHGFPTGTYFYLIRYGAKVYKGTVSLLR